MLPVLRRPAAFVFLLIPVVLITGCRTYGGHGSEEAALSQIEAAYEQFERELAQAKSDLSTLQAAASNNAALAGASAQLDEAVREHEALLAEHAERVEAAREHAGNYRFLHRTLGGMLSEQEMLSRQYQMIEDDLRMQADSTFTARSGSVIPRYHVVPPYFERLQNESYIQPAGNVSRSAEGASAPEPAPGGADTTSDADTTAGV
ncbi:MAG TPA: hypothetical protein VF190_14980 [Rhodothermales bacterium]